MEIKGLLLQWGRDLEVAESSGRGLEVQMVLIASMGPRLGSRGKSPFRLLPRWTTALQWGRDLEVAERSNPRGLFIR